MFSLPFFLRPFFLVFVLGGFFFLPSISFSLSSYSSAPRGKYFIYKEEGLVYIFPEEYKKWMPGLMLKNRDLVKLYEKEFQWSLDYNTYFLFVSPNMYYPNAYAQVSPHYKATFFNGGPVNLVNESDVGMNIEDAAFSLLCVHELAHLFQNSVKASPISRAVHFLLGNIPSPVLYFPNVLTPKLMMEGNATYNESRFHSKGRLYSPTYRALFFSLLKDEQVNVKRLFNKHLFFPFGTEKYIVGAYFNAFLHSHYKNPNIFFLEQSRNWWNPLLINRAFKRSFGKGYHELVLEFERFYEKEAQKQEQLNTPVLARSFHHYGLNKNKEKIFFLTINLRSDHRRNVYDMETRSFMRKKHDLPGGKLFFFKEKGKDQFYSRSNQEIEKETRTAALFDENLRPKKGFENKYVYDIRKGQVLYTDTSSSFFEAPLYKNEEFKGSAFSYPLLDGRGNIFDFKQEGQISYLMKNQKKIFSLKTYFPKLVDVSSQGDEVYFIASTKRGSSLFSLDLIQRKIFRLSSSDRIMDAKNIKGEEFFAVEVSSKGYTYHVFKALKIKEIQPKQNKKGKGETLYLVSFPSISKSLSSKKSSLEQRKTKNQREEKGKKLSSSSRSMSSSHAISPSEFKPYHGIKSLKYVYTKPFAFYYFFRPDLDIAGEIKLLFLDPLMYHGLSTSYDFQLHSKYAWNQFSLQYDYLKYVLDLSFGYKFLSLDSKPKLSGQEFPEPAEGFFDKNEGNHSFFIRGLYPFFHLGRWNFFSGLNFSHNLFYDYYYNSKSQERKYERHLSVSALSSALNVQYLKKFMLSFYPYRLFQLQIQPSWIFLENSLPFQGSVPYELVIFSRGVYDLGEENILEFNFRFRDSHRFFLKTNPFFHSSFHLNSIGESLNPYAISSTRFLSGRFYSGNISYKKVLNWSWYPRHFFIKLRRLAPFVKGDFARSESEELNLLEQEWVYSYFSFSNGHSFQAALSLGMDIEFLIGSDLSARLIFAYRGKSFNLAFKL